MPIAEYEAAAQRGITATLKRDELAAAEWPYHLQIRLSYLGLSTPGDVPTGQAPPPGEDSQGRPNMFVALSECWYRVAGDLFMVWLAWNVPDGPRIVRMTPSPYPRPPYRMALARPMPGEHFTSGMMDDLEPLQILFNDQINQSEEARAIAALPPIAITGSINRTDQYVYGHRRKWFVDDVKSVQPLPMTDTSLASIRAAQMTLAQINSLGGANPSTEGQPTRGLPRAGGAVTALLTLAMADIKDTALILEQEILSPTLADLHRTALTFVPPTQPLQIPGGPARGPMRLTVRDLEGRWAVRWIVAQHEDELRQKGQSMVPFLTGLAKLTPLLQQQGKQINWDALVKRAWRRLQGEDGTEDLLIDAPPPPPMMPGMTPPGGSPPGANGGAPTPAAAIAQLMGGGAGGPRG